MKLTITVKEDVICTNLGKYLKENFNIKLVGLIRFLWENPEVIEEINKKIDKKDSRYRFVKNM